VGLKELLDLKEMLANPANLVNQALRATKDQPAHLVPLDYQDCLALQDRLESRDLLDQLGTLGVKENVDLLDRLVPTDPSVQQDPEDFPASLGLLDHLVKQELMVRKEELVHLVRLDYQDRLAHKD
jgi:hypothetical protein